MKKSSAITAFLVASVMVSAQAKEPKSDSPDSKVPQGSSKTDIESALFNFNLFEKHPDSVNGLIRTAWDYLSAKPDGTFSGLAEEAEFQKLCKESGMGILGGPMLGCISSQGAKVWMRTLKPAQVEVEVTVGDTTKRYGPVESTAGSDLTAIVTVDGLEPGTRHPYKVFVDGEAVLIPQDAAIVTTAKEDSGGKVRIGFGSCFHRWGFGNQKQSGRIRSRKVEAMLLLGDIAAQDRENHLGLHRADYFMRDLYPAWQDLVASVPVYATWDDHDYFKNDAAGIPAGFTKEDKEGVCDVFTQVWNNPSYGFNDERRGVFLRTRIGPADVIMVDNRYFRENKKGSFLGDEQMKWFEEQLLDCKGPFIILSCGSMWSDYVSGGKDSWGKWDPKGRERILNLIEEKKIPGVILVSGDRHGARGFTIPRPSGFDFYEFEAASLGGRCGPPTHSKAWKTQLYGICDEYAYGELSIDASLPDPEVTYRLVQDDGTIIYEKNLKRSELTP
ncbi:MAG: alkaline phosphatase D family protein [Luteolibacter sp.]